MLMSNQIEVSLSVCLLTGLSSHIILCSFFYESQHFSLHNKSQCCKFIIFWIIRDTCFNSQWVPTVFLSFWASISTSVSATYPLLIQWLPEGTSLGWGDRGVNLTAQKCRGSWWVELKFHSFHMPLWSAQRQLLSLPDTGSWYYSHPYMILLPKSVSCVFTLLVTNGRLTSVGIYCQLCWVCGL